MIEKNQEEHTSRSDIIRRALKQYFFIRDFTRARNKVMAELSGKGIRLTEKDIFK